MNHIDRIIREEGGYVFTNYKADKGGPTFAGISRKYHPNWGGWPLVDAQRFQEVQPLVREFYQNYFPEVGNIQNDKVAFAILDFGVMAGPAASTRMAQYVVGATVDGVLGPKTLAALEEYPTGLFLARFALARVAYHLERVARDQSQEVFLAAWASRALRAS